jgi:hypothetical protein
MQDGTSSTGDEFAAVVQWMPHLHEAQYRVLSFIAGQARQGTALGWQDIPTIATATGRAANTVRNSIRALVRKGVMREVPHEDGRQVYLIDWTWKPSASGR